MKREISQALCAGLSGSYQGNTGFLLPRCIFTSPMTISPSFFEDLQLLGQSKDSFKKVISVPMWHKNRSNIAVILFICLKTRISMNSVNTWNSYFPAPGFPASTVSSFAKHFFAQGNHYPHLSLKGKGSLSSHQSREPPAGNVRATQTHQQE